MAKNKERSTSLGEMILMLTDAMGVVSSIASKKEVSEEEVAVCELLTEKFKEDFGEKLLAT